MDGLGSCYHALRNYHKAFEFYDQAIEGAPENTDFLLHRANCYYDQAQDGKEKSYQLSISDVQKALEYAPSDPQLLYKLGIFYFADEQFKPAIKTLKKAIACQPMASHEPEIYYRIGLCYCLIEKFQKAIYPFTKAIGLIPSETKYYHERAKASQMIEDHQSAVDDFDIVIQKNPKNAHAYFRRAFSHKSLKNYSQSVEDFEKAKELDPSNPRMIVNYKQLKGVNCLILCKPGEEKEF